MFCTNCGAQVPDDTKFCTSCGARLAGVPGAAPAARPAAAPAVRNRRVWNNNRLRTPAGGSDFWESGVVRPDRILEDLRTIFEDSDAPTLYYQRLE